ncbi:MAG: ribosome silencing factor [Clostridiales Family XIII bacterium]|nr:ribosome silencing factor [Clostridiales Family XIII bacterium]
MENNEIAMKAARAISDKKGENIVLIDIAEQCSFTDLFLNATASNERQLSSLVGEVEDKLAEDGVEPKNIEGKPDSGWLLMDYGDLVVNIFLPEQRELYKLEKVWGDGKLTEIRDE